MRTARLALIGIALTVVVGAVVYARLPDAASCVASGLTIERDNRYCVGGDGSALMREHVMAHATDPVICLPVTMAIAFLIFLALRRDRTRPGPAAT